MRADSIVRPTQITSFKQYWQLTKPIISLLVVVTAIPTLVMAAGELPSIGIVLAALIGTFLASGSSAVLNHILESDVDEIMQRTRGRPLPSGQVSKPGAIAFSTVIGLAAFFILYFFTTPLAAYIALGAHLFYGLFYTLILKRNTTQNIVIGGAAGAVGPLIGWAAVTGTVTWQAWALFAIIFLWTPPHFWALALKYKKDYAQAKIPMLPVVKGDEVTRRQMFLYTLSLLIPICALFFYQAAGVIYFVPSLVATLYFCYLGLALWRSRDNSKAMPVFHYSCLYLFIIFGSLTIDKILIG